MAKYKISDAVQKDMQQTYRGMGIDEKELQQLESKDYKYQSLDNEVLEQSKNDFMDWMKSSSNKKYGYDFSDPEDIERFEGGKVSKLYEGTYSDNFMDQWLKNNGYASQDYFDTYYKKAEETVYRNRYNESVYNEFKSDVFDKLRENPDAATKSITKDDVSIAVSEVLMSDSKYKYLIDEGLFSNSFATKKTIEDYESDDNFSAEAKYKRDQAAALYDSLEEKKGHTSEDLMNEFTSEYYLVLDKLNWQSEEDERLGQLRAKQDMAVYRNRKAEETQAKKAVEAETDNFIKDIIAKDKDANKIVVQSNLWGTDVTYDPIEISDKAHDDVYDALEAQGLSRYEISAAMARNGMDISRATKYAQFKQEEHRVDNELTAELKDTMRNTGISVALADVKSGQDDTKIGQVSTFADVWRAQKIEEGYDPLAVDNALLREGMEGILSDRTVAEDYMRYVYTAGYGVSAEEAQAQISTVSEEEWERYEKDLKWKADVDESKTTLSERMVPGIIARAALGIASGAVGAADMVVDWVDGEERGAWEITKNLADTSAKMREWATNEHAPGLSAASDIGSEILRMYALSAVGGAAGAGAKAAMGATGKGAAFATSKAGRAILSVAKNAPFISSAVGDYYSEARLNGASASDATQYGLICGVAEGVLEKASVGEALSGAASRRVASNMAARGFSGFASKYGLAATNMFTSALGEFLEESASTTISAVVQRNTWNPNARVDAMEVLQSGGMGAIIGAIMGGASSPVTSRRYELALDILADNNATAKQKILAQDLLTANDQTFAEKLDSLMAATYAETLTEKERAAVMQNGATVMQHDEYVATREALTNAETQLKQEQERYEERIANLDANLQKQEEKVETLRSRFSALDVRDPRSTKRYAELMGQITSAESNLAQIQESTIAQKKAAEKEHTSIVDNLHKTIADNSTKLNRHYVAQYSAQFPVPQKTAEEGKKAKQAELILLEEKWATGDIQAIEDVQESAPFGSNAPETQNNEVAVADTSVLQNAPADAEFAVNQQVREVFDDARRLDRWFKKNFISGFEAGERAAKEQAKIEKGSATLEDMAQVFRNAGGTVDYIMEDGLVDHNRKDTGLGSFKALMYYPDSIKDKVQDYVLNLHNIDRMSLRERGLGENKAIMRNDDGSVRTAEQSREIVKQMEQENPELAVWNERKNRWWNAFGREWIVNTGLVSEEDWATWHATYQNYVPTKREKYQSSNGSKRGKKGSGYSEIRETTGATSEVVDIRDSFAAYINGMVRSAAKNDVVRNLYDFAQRNPNAASPYARITEEDASVSSQDLQNPDPFDALSEESFGEVVDGQYVLRCKVDGEWQKMYVSKDMYDAFNDLFNREYGSGFAELRDVAEKLSGVKRSLITGYNPLFAISNAARDILSAYINDESANPASFVASYIDAAKDMATKSGDYSRFRAYGGDRTGFYKSNEGYLRSAGIFDSKKDQARYLVGKIATVVPRAFAKTGEVSETISRYASAKRYIKRHGDTDENWKKAMQYSADSTTNFSRSGPVTKYADAYCIYLNAAVQGLDKMARQFKNHPLATIGKLAGIALADELIKLLTGNNENEHYQNLSSYVKDQSFLIPNVFGERDDFGYCTTFIAIPKAQGYGAIISLAERLASVWDEDKTLQEAFDNFGDTILSSLPVDPSIPVVSTLKQAASNTSWSGATIEPTRLEAEPLQDRYENDTSVVAIRLSELLVKMGNALGADPNDPESVLAKFGSPAKLQYILDQESGIIGDILLPATAAENFDKFGTEKESYDASSALKAATDTLKRRFVKDPLYSNNIIGDFYNETARLKAESQQEKNRRTEAGIDKKTDTEILYGQYNDVSWWLTASYKAEREILNSQTNSKERDKKLHDIRKERLEVVKEFMEHPKTFKIPD